MTWRISNWRSPLKAARPSKLDPLKPVFDTWLEEDKNNWYKQRASQELVWEPGTAQADFEEADFIENGMEVRKKFLVLSFPFSNDGYSHVTVPPAICRTDP